MWTKTHTHFIESKDRPNRKPKLNKMKPNINWTRTHKNPVGETEWFNYISVHYRLVLWTGLGLIKWLENKAHKTRPANASCLCLMPNVNTHFAVSVFLYRRLMSLNNVLSWRFEIKYNPKYTWIAKSGKWSSPGYLNEPKHGLQ